MVLEGVAGAAPFRVTRSPRGLGGNAVCHDRVYLFDDLGMSQVIGDKLCCWLRRHQLMPKHNVGKQLSVCDSLKAAPRGELYALRLGH